VTPSHVVAALILFAATAVFALGVLLLPGEVETKPCPLWPETPNGVEII
jgi:hypothetical protein